MVVQVKLSSGEQHDVQAMDEEWGRSESKLSLVSIPITLSWHELNYDIMIPAIGQTRQVLNYVSGWGKPGEMVALLGGYGAGKSTLLNCLAGTSKMSSNSFVTLANVILRINQFELLQFVFRLADTT